MIDCSSGQVVKEDQPVYGPMIQTAFADLIGNAGQVPTLAVGAISEADHANSTIAAGRADLCAAARPHLADPRWAPHEAIKIGVTVNAACPGFTETPLTERAVESIVAKTGRTRERALARVARSRRICAVTRLIRCRFNQRSGDRGRRRGGHDGMSWDPARRAFKPYRARKFRFEARDEKRVLPSASTGPGARTR